MGVFYFTLASTYLSALVSRISKNKKFLSLIYAFLVFLIIFIVSACRGDIGDTNAYKHSYSMLYNYTFSTKGDWGFSLLQYILYRINREPQFLVVFTSLVISGFNIFNLYSYSNENFFELEIFMYITSGYFTTSMNGIRQSFVAAIVFTFVRLIEKGKTKTFIILIILMSPFHQSVLIMIPLYFILRSESWSKTTLIVIVISSIGFIGFSKLFPALMGMLEDTNYGDYAKVTLQGSSYMRAIVNCVPVILAFLKRKELKEKWPSSNIFVNISLINFIFIAFSTYNWIFNRFTIYFQLYNFILLPYIIKNCLSAKERKLVYFIFIICYFYFFYREQVIGLNMQYTSDYLNIKNIFYYKVAGGDL